MAPEKTHSQDPRCLPSWEKGQVWPQQPPPPVRAWLLFPLRWSLGATRLFFFSLESFLCFCSPSCLLESLSLYLQLPCS